MPRTTKRDLIAQVDSINRLTGSEPGEPEYLEIGWAYGRPRLSRAGGSVDVGPRLPMGEMLEVLQGMRRGISLMHHKADRMLALEGRDPGEIARWATGN